MRTAMLYNFLIEANITASVAILLMLAVRWLFRKKLGNRAIWFAWLLVAVRLLCPLALPNPLINEIRPSYGDEGMRPMADQVRIRLRDAASDLYWQANVAAGVEDDPLTDTLRAVNRGFENGRTAKTALYVYLAGFGATAVWFAVSNARFRRRLKAGRIEEISGKLKEQYEALCRERGVKPLPVWFTDPLPSACLVGVFRPYIALPLTAKPQDAIHVLAHEVCHYKGKDHLWGVARLACCAVHWFNPLVWLAADMASTDSELACDDRVVAGMTREDARAYAGVLVLAAAKRCAPGVSVLATGMTMTGRKLKTRVSAIVHRDDVKKGLAIAFTALACALLLCAFGTAEYYAPGRAETGDYERVDMPSPVPLTGFDDTVAGFKARNKTLDYVSYTTPGEGDLPLEKAVELAIQALSKQYGESRESLLRYWLEYGFTNRAYSYYESPNWTLEFLDPSGYENFYTVVLHSPDGETLYMFSSAEGNG